MQTAVFRGLQGKVSHGLFVSLPLVNSWKATAHDRQEVAVYACPAGTLD